MIKSVGAVVAALILATACSSNSGSGTGTPSSQSPTASIADTNIPLSTTAKAAAVRLCTTFAEKIAPEIAKDTGTKDGRKLFEFSMDDVDASGGFGATILDAAKAGPLILPLAQSAAQLEQNLMLAINNQEFSTLATEVSDLDEQCATYTN